MLEIWREMLEAESGEELDSVVEKLRSLVPSETELARLASFLRLDVESPLARRLDARKILARTRSLLLYTSLLCEVDRSAVLIGGLGISLLLAIRGETPRFSMDADVATQASEGEVERLVEALNRELEDRGLALEIPVADDRSVWLGRVKALPPATKCGKRVVPLVYATLVPGEGVPLPQYLAREAEKLGLEPRYDLVAEVDHRLRKWIRDARVDGLKISLNLEDARRGMEVEVPGVGRIRVAEPAALVRDKLEVLKSELDWVGAPRSVRINWAVDIVKALLDLRLAKLYGVRIELGRREAEVVKRNVSEALSILERVEATTVLRKTVYLDRPLGEVLLDVLNALGLDLRPAASP